MKVVTAQPNVVLFLVDDMGWMDSGVYGSKYYETPNIDRFATRAMRFTNAYSQPLCSPTRASLLTGQYTARHGITTASGHQPPQPAGHVFLKEIRAAEYADAAAGEQELPRTSADHAGGGVEAKRLSHGAHRKMASRPHAAALAGAAGL
jgi:arylsulfatase A-like enzyme